MPQKRGLSSSNSLSPNDANVAQPFPRSSSPSGSFTQFLTRPAKWFSRSTSAPRLPQQKCIDPRSSTSTIGSRKPKISRPTDARPILETYSLGASKSVVDLSSRPPNSLDIQTYPLPQTPISSGTGDLRSISRKGWSKSADDLSRMSPTTSFPPIKTNFHDKINEYRARSNSNASGAPSTPSSPISIRQPFPTSVQNSPSSASPPRSAGVTISVSAPNVEEESTSTQANPAHNRSHSFTPRLPSKLSNPRFIPPSPVPKRKGSTNSDFDQKVPPVPVVPKRKGSATSDYDIRIDPDPSPSNRLPPALFANISPTQTQQPPSLLAPAVIHSSTHEKRGSQVLYHSGFINRQTDAHSLSRSDISLSKGWKPFKMELKGSKLYLYKPPGDRNTAIRDLFPTEFVPPTLDEDVVDLEKEDISPIDIPKGSRTAAREDGPNRRKRTYWGRKTHPDLVTDAAGEIEKGTLEALIHEMVFGTTFDVTTRTDAWRQFASVILLTLPCSVGAGKFDAEFLRCTEFLITGAEDAEKPALREKVSWLASQYIEIGGNITAASGWQNWKTQTEVDVVHQPCSVPPSSSSIVGLYTPSPAIGPTDQPTSSTPESNIRSPHVNTFSPRPNTMTATVTSIMDALSNDMAVIPPFSVAINDKIPSTPSERRKRRGKLTSPPPWKALEEEGLTRDVLLAFDPYLLSESLTAFHRQQLEQGPSNLTAAQFLDDINPSSSLNEQDALKTFFGNEAQPHWLTKMLLLQILGGDGIGHAKAQRVEDYGGSPQTSRTHTRSELISIWAQVGELCRLGGDECTWRAISAALCSRPLARLDKAWKRVDPSCYGVVEAWARQDNITVQEPRLTPWGGDSRSDVQEQLQAAKDTEATEETWKLKPLVRVWKAFEEFRKTYSLCPRKLSTEDNDEWEECIRKMTRYWEVRASEGGGSGGVATKFLRIDQFLSLSLAAEARRKGLFEPYFWSKPSMSHSPTNVLIPLLFVDPLPVATFVDRITLLRGRPDADPSEGHFGSNMAQPHSTHEHRVQPEISELRRTLLGDVSSFRGGTVIPVYNGDLLLVVQTGDVSRPNSRPSSRAPSRPPSSVDAPTPDKQPMTRSPSIRVKAGASQGLDRKSSMARRSSLPLISQRSNVVVSEPSAGPPLRVQVRAGTLNSLVNTLVFGLQNMSISVADDNGEISLREGKTRELSLDQSDFSHLWWHVFRSFITPPVFFELLKKLYVTGTIDGLFHPPIDIAGLVSIRCQVLETIKNWVTDGGGAQDVLDEPQLYAAINNFIRSDIDHSIPKIGDCEPQKQDIEVLIQSRQLFTSAFISQTMRPSPRPNPLTKPSNLMNGTRMRSMSTREVPDIDRIDVEEFVDNLDGMVCAAFSNISQEDMYITADILEAQTADRVGWFPPKDFVTGEDYVEIQTIFSHILEVPPSALTSGLSQETLYRLLPPGLRSSIRAYSILRKWIVSKLIAPGLGLRIRQGRMELLVKALEVARLRTSAMSVSPHQCARSGVEAVIASAMLSVESRLHQRAWQNVALGRGVACDSLSGYISKPSIKATRSQDPLVVDLGWVIERLMEIISSPDVLDSPDEGQNLVNLDKRRHICNFISNTLTSFASLQSYQQDHIIRRGFERLTNLEREVSGLRFDLRNVKDEASREAMSATTLGSASAKKIGRPFQKILASQIEKNRRDKSLRSRLAKERSVEQSRLDKREEVVNRAMRPRKAIQLSRQHRNKKSMSSAILHFMRPLSTAFGGEIQASPIRRTPSELDFTPSGKPALVLSLVHAQVAQFINNERSFTFLLDTEDGGHYLFQALSKQEMKRWMENVDRVAKVASQRRLTYLGAPKPQVSDHLINQASEGTNGPLAVFGVELTSLIRREVGTDDPPPGSIPSIIETCLTEIETRGLTEVGIYRIAGASSEINHLKDAFNRGESPITPITDIHAVCDLVKSWFRVLPESVFPPASYYAVIEAMKIEFFDARLAEIRNVVQGLPQLNYDLLKRICEHLEKVSDYEEQNNMTADALAIVFSPNLLRAPRNDFQMILANMGYTHKLVNALITHFNVIFDEADADAEPDADDDELESPILEEDEEEEDILT